MHDPRQLRLCSSFIALSLSALSCGKGMNGTTTGTGGSGGGAPADPESVVTRGKTPTRTAFFVQPLLTKASAAKMALDATFKPTITGKVYAAPLYVLNGPGGKGVFFVVTEDNNVHAVAEADGATVWTKNLGPHAGGPPGNANGSGCGNILPLGITGTPVIDLPSRTLYVDAVIGTAMDGSGTIKTHEIHALSIDDGTEKPHFPFDASKVSFKTPQTTVKFDPVPQNQRGALLLVNGILYVAYGGHAGDCGVYHGWVIGVPVANPAAAQGFATGAPNGGGMWASGGPASDGTSVFVSTGNTFGANVWSQGEGVLRFRAGPVWSGQPADYFAPSNWKPLDAGDVDLGGSGALLVDVPGATPSALAVALGKNGVVYLLDRNNLGGIGKGNGTTGEGVNSLLVANGAIINAAASYRTAKGTYVVFHAHGATGVGCPAGQLGDLVSLKISVTSPPTLSVAWCVVTNGQGSPIATSTDGTSEVVVWSAGAEGDQRLRSWDGDTGAVIFAGGGAGDVMANTTRRFNSPIAVKGRIVVAADNALYAFKTM